MQPITVPDFAIVPAKTADLDRIVQIAQDSFSFPWTRKMFEAELSGNPFASLVTAQAQDQEHRHTPPSTILGYLCYWVVFEELRLMDLAVDPSVRRRGVARMLVSHALRSAQEAGVQRAVLEVRAANQPAHALYEQFGFRQVTRRVNYYTHPMEDAILMELSPLTLS